MIITARQISAQATDRLYAEDLVAQAVAAAALTKQLIADAQRAVELASGDPIAELTAATATYFSRDDHDDDLWADVELAEAALAPLAKMADTLEHLTRR